MTNSGRSSDNEPQTASPVTRWLERSSPVAFSIYTSIAAFATYSSMYAFRKPFAVGTYEGLTLAGLDYKVVLILSQIAGYTLSKFIGIRAIAEIHPRHRIVGILILIACAEAALLLFAVVPYPYNFPLLFFNGLPLGMVWGLVFGCIEGRRVTEILSAALTASFAVSSGVVKAVGKFTMDQLGVAEMWMPFVTGTIFVPPLLFFVWMLHKVPPPTAADRAARTERTPMHSADRRSYLRTLGPALLLLVFVHMLLTAMRDFRDNFAIEILTAVGYGEEARNLANSEVVIGVLVLIVIALLFRVRDNRRALGVIHGMIFVGLSALALSTLAFRAELLPPYVWYTVMGFSLYLAYVPFHSVLFERVVAAVGKKANAAFLIYVADATGYLSSVAVLLYKQFGAAELSWLEFFVQSSYAVALLGCTGTALAYILFRIRLAREPTEKPPPTVPPLGDSLPS